MANIHKDIGERLRAYRMGSGLSAEEIGERLGLSRAGVYRIENGEVVKVETLEKLSAALDTSVASLLGVDVEYYAKPVSFFERMRQLENGADQIVAHFQPFSLLLMTDAYVDDVRRMLVESQPSEAREDPRALERVDALTAILRERKAAWRRRRLSVVNIITFADIERFLKLGAVGRLDLPEEELVTRRASARREVENLVRIIEDEPMGIQIGLVEEPTLNITFQLFRGQGRTMLAISPFRLGGELPNVRTGVAMLTAAEEPVRLYEDMAQDLWRRAHKGPQAAEMLRGLLERTSARPKLPAKRRR